MALSLIFFNFKTLIFINHFIGIFFAGPASKANLALARNGASTDHCTVKTGGINHQFHRAQKP
jgi:hypothetical protein